MEEKKTHAEEVSSDTYDASDRPFDFVGEDVGTALICESDASLRKKLAAAMKNLGYQITEPALTKDALKNMRYHVYDVVIVNENFDTDNPATNEVLQYLANLNMSTRREIFVTVISSRFRTMDNMAAYNQSANLIINTKNINDAGQIIKSGINDNDAFYHVYKEILRKKGRG
jgi:ActR/RegA family two-component response regulator